MRHAKKPGQQATAEIEENKRKSFSQDLIRAIEDAQLAAAASKPPAQLAGEAYTMLQYDFPVSHRLKLMASTNFSGPEARLLTSLPLPLPPPRSS